MGLLEITDVRILTCKEKLHAKAFNSIAIQTSIWKNLARRMDTEVDWMATAVDKASAVEANLRKVSNHQL